MSKMMDHCERKITPEQVANLRAQRATGETLRALGKRFGYSAEGVRLLLRDTGGDPKPPPKSVIGQTFHEWTVIDTAPSGPSQMRRVLCRCSCGNERVIYLTAVKNNETKSCGHNQGEQITLKCSRWLTYQGRTKPLQCWCRELGLKRITVSRRLNTGWSVEEALGTPVYGRYGSPESDKRGTKRTLNEWQAIGVMAELLMGFNCRQVAERRGLTRGAAETIWYRRTWGELFVPEEMHGDENEAASAADAR